MFALYHNYSEYVCIIKEKKKKCPHIEEFDTNATNICLRYPDISFFAINKQLIIALNIRAHDQNERVEMCDVVRCVGV